ncbi:ATP-grasp domain-containing protein [Burkholderia vietnamiensis]|uniref:ATP-grasp domain-containing protein n=1 Tax=Burkholderia vietnamiensis TaxID=60552 RepID=UPI00075A39F5|nr:ATP-grasp domain-containing protein [Burkholderia vietnamiensis]KVF72778.1 carboxylate--amine ligase [Burkholderia vietnamiensis]KVR79096.1 carboxylate--amine ligase [Burkholderia vietnamiensis]KVR90914.1 carboxylate--amine ligase [Burkholderia vietnamiensis]KVS29227.1 carboxylate--amine ligase [Burkholderia vietnamiensis]MBR8147275.1 ATP-grasp domain-containing protein [Burkholderia vietnamiensis]
MNILIINNLAQFPGTGRWDFDLVRYDEFVDHRQHRVSYLVNRRGRSAVTASADSYRLYELDRLDDIAAYRTVIAEIVGASGPIDRLIVFSESLQDLAAQLRAEFDIPGKKPDENRLGRDKLLMKQKVEEAGLRTPRYRSVTSTEVSSALTFAEHTGYPLILKPIDGQSSHGVQKICDAVQLRTAIANLPSGGEWDLEEFVAGTLMHVDGLVDRNGNVTLVVPSRYVNTCLDFTAGAPLGAIMLEPGTALHAYVSKFATQCVTAIGLRACPFHLELFHTTDDELVFLEVGARVGGADVPSMIHRATGINLFREWVNMSLDQPAQLYAPTGSVGAWLMFPRPTCLPQRVRSVTRFDGRLDSLYRQLVPNDGQLIEHEDGYCSLQSGRFLFDSPSGTQVARDVAHVLEAFRIETTQP